MLKIINTKISYYENIFEMNYAFGFSIFLIGLISLNIYFFITLSSVRTEIPDKHVMPIIIDNNKADLSRNIYKDIYDHLNYLPIQFRSRNSKFLAVQQSILKNFSVKTYNDSKAVWTSVQEWKSETSLFPNNDALGQILNAMQTSQIVLTDNAPKGTQLKLLLLLDSKQKLFFKPKRYNMEEVVSGDIYAGFDRHNSEVFGYYLAMLLNFTWVAPSVIRKIKVNSEILPTATLGLRKTMVRNSSGSLCIYGKCFYCKKNETVCPDNNGEIEGAAILYLDKQFSIHKSPWRRSYTSKKMEWEKDSEFCKKISTTLNSRRLLNIIDISIFDFLIQNGDRHRYEVYKDQIVLLDNGKGLGNPRVDAMDILAPLYQCCILNYSTWRRLELVSGGALTDTIKLIAALQQHVIATENHFKAVERRLLKVYATIQYCIGKNGSAKVYRN